VAGIIALIDQRESNILIRFVACTTLWGFFVHFSCEGIHDGRIQYFKEDQHVYASQTMYISPLVTIGKFIWGDWLGLMIRQIGIAVDKGKEKIVRCPEEKVVDD
jgi:hypothetical protein